MELVDNIKVSIPAAAITTDIIVGFPGETEDDFLQTVDLVEKVRFDSAFSFIYSPREKTKAAQFEDRLSYREKEQRLHYLNKIQQQISTEKNELLLNTIQEVLVEGPSKNNPDLQSGRTRTNKLVHFSGNCDLTGTLQQVKVTKARTWDFFGELVRTPFKGDLV